MTGPMSALSLDILTIGHHIGTKGLTEGRGHGLMEGIGQEIGEDPDQEERGDQDLVTNIDLMIKMIHPIFFGIFDP